MPNVGPLTANQACNRASIPRHFHSERSSNETETEGCNCTPSERQHIRFIPSIEVVLLPRSGSKYQMLIHDHNNVDDSPVSYDAQECLEGVVKVFGGTCSNDNSSHETACDEDSSGDPKRPGAEVLSMHGERVVVWNIVL